MLEFQVADPEVLRKRLVDAGLRDVIVDTAQRESVEVRSGKQFWDWTLGGKPVPGMLVAELSDAQRHEVVAVLDGMVKERADLHGAAVLAAAQHRGGHDVAGRTVLASGSRRQPPLRAPVVTVPPLSASFGGPRRAPPPGSAH